MASSGNLYPILSYSFFLFYSNLLFFFFFLISEFLYYTPSFSSALNSVTNENVAIKKIANAFDNKIDAKRTLREIKLLRHMDYENVSHPIYLIILFP